MKMTLKFFIKIIQTRIDFWNGTTIHLLGYDWRIIIQIQIEVNHVRQPFALSFHHPIHDVQTTFLYLHFYGL